MQKQIGFIGGGQMAEALIKGIIAAELYPPEAILVSEHNEFRRDHLQEHYKVQTFFGNEQIFANCATVILAVKPQGMGDLLVDCAEKIDHNHILITIAAGLPISFYMEKIGKPESKIIRVMPNTPALVLEGASALSHNSNVDEEDLAVAKPGLKTALPVTSPKNWRCRRCLVR